MMKDAWQMLYRTQERLPWINSLSKNVLGNIVTLDMKAQLWVQLFYTFPLVQHFNQSECRGGWSLHLEITRKRLHLFHTSGHMHYAKLVHLYHQKMCTLQDGHGQGWIPFLHRGRLLYHPMQWQVLVWFMVWYDHKTGIDMHTMVSGGLTSGCRITENTLAKWGRPSLYTTVYPNWGAHWQPGWVFWAVLWGMSPQRLETNQTDRSGKIHVEHQSWSTALLALWWWSRFTVLWHYWWLLGELPQCRERRPAVSTACGWKKFCCFQKWRGRLSWWL